MKTELKKVHLHTRRLLPAFIVHQAMDRKEDLDNLHMSDTIMTWIEKEQHGHRFEPNDEVYDMDNLGLKMRVVQILKKVEKVKVGDIEKTVKRIKGVECEYWN